MDSKVLSTTDVSQYNSFDTSSSFTENKKPKSSRIEVPIKDKFCLTINEAAAYSNIGINKMSTLANSPNCSFVIRNGAKKLINRHKFEEYLDERRVI